MPGECGAELRGLDDGAAGEEGNCHVDFSIAIQPDGRVDVNGEVLTRCDPDEGCWISVAWSAESLALVVQIEDASGALCVAQYSIPEAPTEIAIVADEVVSLSVTAG